MTRKLLEPILAALMASATFFVAFGFVVLGYPIPSIIWAVLSGWLMVAWRAVMQVEMNLAGIATAALCAALTVLLLHYLAAWLYAAVRSKKAPSDGRTAWRWRWTLSIVAALVLMFVAGLVGVGLFRTTSWFLETPQVFKSNNSLS